MAIFPTHLVNPKSVRLWLEYKTIQSGPSISGIMQSIRSDGGGVRMCELSGIILKSADDIRRWEAWQAELQGGAEKVTVPIPINRYAPRPLQGGMPAPYGALENGSDDPYFPEAAGYGLEMVTVSASASAALRATQISVTMEKGSIIKGGEAFSINHATKGNHIYRIARVLSRAGNDYTIKLDCPLREAIAGGESLNFDWPLMDAYLMPDSDISLMIENRRSEVSIAFREAF